jgi:hypothetical protein
LLKVNWISYLKSFNDLTSFHMFIFPNNSIFIFPILGIIIEEVPINWDGISSLYSQFLFFWLYLVNLIHELIYLI